MTKSGMETFRNRYKSGPEAWHGSNLTLKIGLLGSKELRNDNRLRSGRFLGRSTGGARVAVQVPRPWWPIPQRYRERRADRASDLWDRARPIESGDPVHRYLTGRGIVLDTWPEELRCHPRLDYWEIVDGKSIKTGIFPCMLAAVRNLQGSPVALHRT